MQRFELEHQRKFGRAPQLVLNDVRGDFRRQRKGKAHKELISLSYLPEGVRSRIGKIGLRRFGVVLQKSRQKESSRGNTARGVDAATTHTQENGCQDYCGARESPIESHLAEYKRGQHVSNN